LFFLISVPGELLSNNTLERSAEETARAASTIEISVKGKWYKVPALYVNGNPIITKGGLMKTAVVDAEEWLPTEIEDPQLCVEKLKDRRLHKLRADLFTFTQKPTATDRKYDYRMELDSIAAVRTTSFQTWWEKLPQESRKNVRRSQKRGVVVTVRELDDELYKDLVELNNDSSIRQGKSYTHYGKSVDQVKKDQESFAGRRELIWAHADGELVGLLKLVYRGDVASILHLIPKVSQQDKRPANALIAKAVELCAARGVLLLTFGMFNYGNKRESSLKEFKVRNGFEEVLVPRYYVPLSVWGQIGMRMGLHRGLVGVLPEGALAMGVWVRARLYSVKQFFSRCSSVAERSNRNRQTECSNPPAGSNS
jgi:hypothetical protein